MEENRFLLETYADLLSQGVASNLQHVWNSAHTIIIFFDSPPPSGAERYHFRVFRKKDGSTWEKAGEYHYSSRYAPDWKREMLLMGDEGFFIIIRDHQTTIRHFFDFSRSEESFEVPDEGMMVFPGGEGCSPPPATNKESARQEPEKTRRTPPPHYEV